MGENARQAKLPASNSKGGPLKVRVKAANRSSDQASRAADQSETG